ncbi:MAG TPA: ATP synthase F1 subunit delta [bacterium]|nr:ATP synthase F1 subunit delta [bacterium]
MSVIARRYAQALMNLAVKAKAVEPTAAGLDEVADSVAGSPELQALLEEPKVALADKEAVIVALLDKTQAPTLVATFVRFITRKRRAGLLDDIRSEFHDLADERMGRASADVTVASALSTDQEQALRERLQALSGKEIKLRVQIDPGILGGVVARIGSTVWDGSLRNQLTQIHQSIAQG